MKRAVLLDVSAIMYRAYYGNIRMSNKTEATGAVFGFYNMLTSIIKELKPDYMAAAFDVKRKNLKRTEKYENYKAHRDGTPDDLISQIPRIEQLLDAFKIERFKIEGYEADDVLGSIAHKLKNDMEVIILTGDKDLSQLVEENITVALLGKGDGQEKFGLLKTEEDVVKFIGVKPDKILELFALIGDKSDGIPGVRKIGDKKALAILEKYDTLEKIYENVDKLSEIEGIGKGLVQNIIEDKELAFLSRDLAKIETALDIDLAVKEMNYNIDGDIDKRALYNLCKELDFRSILKRINLDEIDSPVPKGQARLFDSSTFNVVEKTETTKLETRAIKIIENDLEELKKDLQEADKFAVYFDSIALAITTKNNDYYLPLFHKSLTVVNVDVKELRTLFESIDAEVIAYNFKEIMKLNLGLKNIKIDIMIAYHLLKSDTRIDVTSAINYYLNANLLSFKASFPKQKIENINIEDLSKYMLARSRGLYEIYDSIKADLKENDLYKFLVDLEMPLIEVLDAMEKQGIKIDREYFSKFSDELTKTLKDLEEKIYFETYEEFNINSPKQLSEILFEKMNITPIKKTKTGYSTDITVLEELNKRGIKVAYYLLEHRKLNKLKTTYVDALLSISDDDRIHTTFNQIGTVTGRLSSLEPNLQNIPVKTEEGMKVRRGFIADEGKVFMSIDYSQVELRVLAELSQEPNLIKAYKENLDLHNLTAQKIFNLNSAEEVTRIQRTMAKIVNFSIIYGKTPFGLSQELDIPVSEADSYIKKYFAEYPRVATFEKEIYAFAEEHGYVKTLFGRKRDIENINSRNKNEKNQAERMAVNTVIQGTAAEIIKKVMIEIYALIKNETDIKLLLQVHDELIFELDENSVEKYKKNIANIMKNSVKLENVDLDINISIGKNWSEAK